jgi:hypothetical protein
MGFPDSNGHSIKAYIGLRKLWNRHEVSNHIFYPICCPVLSSLKMRYFTWRILPGRDICIRYTSFCLLHPTNFPYHSKKTLVCVPKKIGNHLPGATFYAQISLSPLSRIQIPGTSASIHQNISINIGADPRNVMFKFFHLHFPSPGLIF